MSAILEPRVELSVTREPRVKMSDTYDKGIDLKCQPMMRAHGHNVSYNVEPRVYYCYSLSSNVGKFHSDNYVTHSYPQCTEQSLFYQVSLHGVTESIHCCQAWSVSLPVHGKPLPGPAVHA